MSVSTINLSRPSCIIYEVHTEYPSTRYFYLLLIFCLEKGRDIFDMPLDHQLSAQTLVTFYKVLAAASS